MHYSCLNSKLFEDKDLHITFQSAQQFIGCPAEAPPMLGEWLSTDEREVVPIARIEISLEVVVQSHLNVL